MMNQRKNNQGPKAVAAPRQMGVSSIKPTPAGPAVYRPQPTPKVLQLKTNGPSTNKTVAPPNVSIHPPVAQKRAPGLPQSSNRPVVPPVNNIHRQPAVNNRPATANGNQQRRDQRPHVPSQVVQRVVDFDDFPDDVILLIMTFMGMRICTANGRPNILNLALTSTRMHRIASHEYSPLAHSRELFFTRHRVPAILQNYAHTLEPLLHGAHLSVERLGLPGSGTILGLALNGELIPWRQIPEDFQNANRGLKSQEWEQHVKGKVTTYSGLSIKARPEREAIEQLPISRKQKKALQSENEAIVQARENSPAATFQVFLLMNRTLVNPAQFEGKVESWLLKRKNTLLHLLFGSGIEAYEELGLTEEEEKSCGHSEQLMLMKAEWENIKLHFFKLAKIRMQDAEAWIQPQQVVIMLNRSPCSSCGRLLMAELVTFWEALAAQVNMNVDLCRLKFERLFIFRLAYTVKYGKLGISKKFYPNATILSALEMAGWVLEKLPKFTSAQRKPDSCFDTATLSTLKQKPVNLKKIQIQQKDSDSDYAPSSEDDSDDSGHSPVTKRRKKDK